MILFLHSFIHIFVPLVSILLKVIYISCKVINLIPKAIYISLNVLLVYTNQFIFNPTEFKIINIRLSILSSCAQANLHFAKIKLKLPTTQRTNS